MRNLKFRVPESFIRNISKSASFCSRGRYYLLLYWIVNNLPFFEEDILSKAVDYTNLFGKDRPELKLPEPPLTGHGRMQETHRELFSNRHYSTLQL